MFGINQLSVFGGPYDNAWSHPRAWGTGSWPGWQSLNNLSASWFSAGTNYRSHVPSYLPIGSRQETYGSTTWERGGWRNGTDTHYYSSSRTPVWEYEKSKAVDYKFQVGEKFHNVDVQTQVSTVSQRIDPVILDLNNDGKLDLTPEDNSLQNINETSQSSTSVSQDWRGNRLDTTTTTTTRREWDTLKNWNNKIDYDVNGDGTVDRTQWTAKGTRDAFLVYDNNQDGKISGNELMNEGGIDGRKDVYKTGWEKARALADKNGDGKLTGAELNGFQVWQDANGDGVTDAGELKSLGSLNIFEIDTVEGSFSKRKEVGFNAKYNSYTSYRVQ